MSLDISTLITAVQDHVLVTGLFDSVNGHEPKAAPGHGLTAAVWPQAVGPARGASGLAATAARVPLMVRLYYPIMTDPADMIDPVMVGAIDVLMTAYNGDFTLGGLIRNIDVLGAQGDPLGGQAGYLVVGGEEYRVWDILLPLICNDLWDQEASE